MYRTINLKVEVESQEVVNELRKEGYVVVENTTEAINFIQKDSSESRLLFNEKENVRIFFAQDKFKSVPNKDLLEFLNKY